MTNKFDKAHVVSCDGNEILIVMTSDMVKLSVERQQLPFTHFLFPQFLNTEERKNTLDIV